MAANSACKILEFYIEEKMKKISSERYYDISEEINNCLLPVYRMAKYSKEWLKQIASSYYWIFLQSEILYTPQI